MIVNNAMRKRFNLAVSKTRICVENILGKLKNRFKVLDTIKHSLVNMPETVLAYTVLFNIYKTFDCIDTSDLFDGISMLDDANASPEEERNVDADGFIIRETIT